MMPEVNRLIGKHLFPSDGSNKWFADAYLVLYVCRLLAY